MPTRREILADSGALPAASALTPGAAGAEAAAKLPGRLPRRTGREKRRARLGTGWRLDRVV